MNEKQRGFSLIEVLIGLIFLAIGLLAIAALQAKGIWWEQSKQFQ